MTQITIAQLYPAELGVTGDRGNVRAIEARLAAAGIESTTTLVGIGEALPEDLDILVIGNGPLSAMRGVHADLAARGEFIRSFAADGGVLLSVGGSAELLSRGVTTLDGETIDGLGVFDATVARTRSARSATSRSRRRSPCDRLRGPRQRMDTRRQLARLRPGDVRAGQLRASRRRRASLRAANSCASAMPSRPTRRARCCR